MLNQNSHTANAATPLFNVAPGSLPAQVNSGDTKTLSKLGNLYAALVPHGSGIDGLNIILRGETAGFQAFVRDIRLARPVIVNPSTPAGRHLKAPVFGLSLQTSDTALVLASDPASHYFRQHFWEWVKTGKVLVGLIPASTHQCSRLAIPMRDVDTDLNGWSQYAESEPDPVKRLRQVMKALQAVSPVKKTVIISVVEMQLR